MKPAAPLHIESSGHGAPVVFWHGWGTNLRVFDAVRGALSVAWRTTAVDLPGHGLSSWGDGAEESAADGETMLSRLVATLPPATAGAATLVGWSLGGQFALRAAALYPERIERLVLISTTPRFVRAADWPQGVDAIVLQDMQARLMHDYGGTLGDFLDLQVRGSRDAELVQRTLRAALLTHGEAQPAALAAGLSLLESTDLRPQLAAIDIPALVIAGQYDRVTPPAAGVALAAALPRATFVELQRAAHAPFLSHREQVVAALRDFLGGASV